MRLTQNQDPLGPLTAVFTSKDMKAIAIHLSGKEGAFNKGTLLSEIFSHLQQGTYTRPRRKRDLPGELTNNEGNENNGWRDGWMNWRSLPLIRGRVKLPEQVVQVILDCSQGKEPAEVKETEPSSCSLL
ncbi:uncharacterized protein [Montipora foliosa]|uniref:uncharacterized protein n=1 Tax=Montipora foliosa TaxID=591990 RepID=UPI0035F172FE